MPVCVLDTTESGSQYYGTELDTCGSKMFDLNYPWGTYIHGSEAITEFSPPGLTAFYFESTAQRTTIDGTWNLAAGGDPQMPLYNPIVVAGVGPITCANLNKLPYDVKWPDDPASGGLGCTWNPLPNYVMLPDKTVN